MIREMESRHEIKLTGIHYLGYAALVWAKQALGIKSKRHRKFLIWKLVKLIRSGKIDLAKLSITSMGKTDGVGAQAMAKFSAMCFAEAYGIKYIHVPFQNLAHAETDVTEWTESWERLLDMNVDECVYEKDSIEIVKLEDYLQNTKFWNQRVLLADLNFHPFCELAPVYGSEISKKLKKRFNRRNTPAVKNDIFKIGVHIRRGDVRIGDADTGHRFTTNDHTLSLLEQVVEVISGLGCRYEIHLHTNGSMDEVIDFSKNMEITYHAGSSAINTFMELAGSDVLITARSDFSMLAGIYCDGVVICDSRHRTPLHDWIKVSPGSMDIKNDLESKLGQVIMNLNSKPK